tara:strand:+ start:11082 stop:11411 length:330 start_codon:yes stop_codon:yes gene_type:complete
METKTTDKKERAKRRVAELKGFYVHLTVYIIVNVCITVFIIGASMSNGTTFIDAFWNFGNFATPFFWGIGLFFHAMKVFSFYPFFGKDWEERQIQKYMEEDKRDIEKYR